jgi:hypothetical protein
VTILDRSAVNSQSGVQTPVGGIFTGEPNCLRFNSKLTGIKEETAREL